MVIKRTFGELNEERNELSGHINFLYTKMINAYNENIFAEGKIYYKLLLKSEKKLEKLDIKIRKLNNKNLK